MLKKFLILILLIIFLAILVWRIYSSSATQKTSRNSTYVSYAQKALVNKNVFAKMVDRLYPEPSGLLLNGMLFGIRGDIKGTFYENLQKAGMLHVVALSGQNISILIAVIFKLTSIFGKKQSIIVSSFGICAFIMFVGPSPSVVRAGIMGVLSLIALLAGRQYLALWGLGLSAIVMVLVKPDVLMDVGFQLSFLATLGIIVFSQKTARTANGIKERLVYDFRATFWTSVSALVFTTPIIIANFGRFSSISLLTNVLVLWTVPIIMGLGFVSSLLSLIVFPLGHLVAFFANLFLIYFVLVVNISANLPFASFKTEGFKIWMGLLYYGVVFLLLAWKKRNMNIHFT